MAYDDPLFSRVKQRLQQRSGNALKELVKTPLSIRRTLLVAAAYEKLKQKAFGTTVTLDILEKFHPGLSVATAEMARLFNNVAVREFALDFLCCEGSGGGKTALPQDLFTQYFEVVSFYKLAEADFEKALQTVFLLSPLDLVTMASKRLDAVQHTSSTNATTTPQRRGSFSSIASSRDSLYEASSDAENLRPSTAAPLLQPPMPTPTPPRARRAGSSASLRSKSFMEATASSVAGEWKDAAATASGIATAGIAVTSRPSPSSSFSKGKKKQGSGGKARRHSVDGAAQSPPSSTSVTVSATGGSCGARGCAEGSASSSVPAAFLDARGAPVRVVEVVQRAPLIPVVVTHADGSGARGCAATAPADDGLAQEKEQERRRICEENALLRKKMELLRQKVRVLAEEAAAARKAQTLPAPAAPDRDKAYLDVIASLQATVDAQAATIKGQQELIRTLTSAR